MSRGKKRHLRHSRTSTGLLPQAKAKTYAELYPTHPGVEISYHHQPSEDFEYALSWALLDYDQYINNELLAELKWVSSPFASELVRSIIIKIQEFDQVYLFDVCLNAVDEYIELASCETYKQAVSVAISLMNDTDMLKKAIALTFGTQSFLLTMK